jgi:hypothetical protein
MDTSSTFVSGTNFVWLPRKSDATNTNNNGKRSANNRGIGHNNKGHTKRKPSSTAVASTTLGSSSSSTSLIGNGNGNGNGNGGRRADVPPLSPLPGMTASPSAPLLQQWRTPITNGGGVVAPQLQSSIAATTTTAAAASIPNNGNGNGNSIINDSNGNSNGDGSHLGPKGMRRPPSRSGDSNSGGTRDMVSSAARRRSLLAANAVKDAAAATAAHAAMITEATTSFASPSTVSSQVGGHQQGEGRSMSPTNGLPSNHNHKGAKWLAGVAGSHSPSDAATSQSLDRPPSAQDDQHSGTAPSTSRSEASVTTHTAPTVTNGTGRRRPLSQHTLNFAPATVVLNPLPLPFRQQSIPQVIPSPSINVSRTPSMVAASLRAAMNDNYNMNNDAYGTRMHSSSAANVVVEEEERMARDDEEEKTIGGAHLGGAANNMNRTSPLASYGATLSVSSSSPQLRSGHTHHGGTPKQWTRQQRIQQLLAKVDSAVVTAAVSAASRSAAGGPPSSSLLSPSSALTGNRTVFPQLSRSAPGSPPGITPMHEPTLGTGISGIATSPLTATEQVVALADRLLAQSMGGDPFSGVGSAMEPSRDPHYIPNPPSFSAALGGGLSALHRHELWTMTRALALAQHRLDNVTPPLQTLDYVGQSRTLLTGITRQLVGLLDDSPDKMRVVGRVIQGYDALVDRLAHIVEQKRLIFQKDCQAELDGIKSQLARTQQRLNEKTDKLNQVQAEADGLKVVLKRSEIEMETYRKFVYVKTGRTQTPTPGNFIIHSSIISPSLPKCGHVQ